jgi:dolichol-phosphate mannosyltransferase
LYEDLSKEVLNQKDISFELVFVDDGSYDRSWEVLNELKKKDDRIICMRLSRNFGSHAAILCGLEHASGDCAVIKAADMQEPSSLILDMYREWQNGYNVVLAVRQAREDQSFFSELYYTLTRKFIFPNMPKHGFDIFLVDRKVIKVLENLDEKNSAITGQILWSGFRTKEVLYTRKQRQIGKGKWTLKKKIRLVMDTLFSFSSLPISFITFIGILSISLSFLWACYIVIQRLKGNIYVEGYTTLMVFQLFSFGITMLTLGLIGNYLWRAFDASRRRPVYIVEDENEKEDPR